MILINKVKPKLPKLLNNSNLNQMPLPSKEQKMSSTLLHETSISKKTPAQNIDNIKDWYFTSLLVCFAGIIGLYSGYAYLQESL